MSPTLFQQIANEFELRHVVECGVSFPEYSAVIPYVESRDIKVELFEPLPGAHDAILKWISRFPNNFAYNVALGPAVGSANLLVPAGGGAKRASAHMEGANAPSCVNDNCDDASKKRIVVEVRTFDEYDNGDIDAITLDMEGFEWYVLARMRSRPNVISIELGHPTKAMPYRNPFETAIKDWMTANDYAWRVRDKQDHIFTRGT